MPTAVIISALKATNVKERRFVSIHLSSESLENPMPLRCMFCGEPLHIATHWKPDMVIDAKIRLEDCFPIIDSRCGKCKTNWRFYK